MTRQAIDALNHKEIPVSSHSSHDERHGVGAPVPGGLAVSQDGYTPEPVEIFFEPGTAAPFSFRITDARGRALNRVAPEQSAKPPAQKAGRLLGELTYDALGRLV